jgi:tetratricopeptide (TPR) repeat protein
MVRPADRIFGQQGMVNSKHTAAEASRDPQAWYLLGVAALQSGTLEGAVQAFLRTVELAPGSERALSAAEELAVAGARSGAERILRRARALNPHRADLRDALVTLLIEDGRERAALAEVAAALAVEPDDVSLRLLAATAYDRLGQPDHAIDELVSITARHPGHAEANRRLGTLLAEKGDLAGSIRCWRQVVAQAGAADHEALTTLGRQLSLAGEHAEALRILYDVAATHPALASAQANLGMALLAAGRNPEAICAFSRVLALDAAWPRPVRAVRPRHAASG